MVVSSPATTQTPLVTSASTATRPRGSSFSTASRMASEIWSQSLSGCPSVTDSEVNNFFINSTKLRKDTKIRKHYIRLSYFRKKIRTFVILIAHPARWTRFLFLFGPLYDHGLGS